MRESSRIALWSCRPCGRGLQDRPLVLEDLCTRALQERPLALEDRARGARLLRWSSSGGASRGASGRVEGGPDGARGGFFEAVAGHAARAPPQRFGSGRIACPHLPSARRAGRSSVPWICRKQKARWRMTGDPWR